MEKPSEVGGACIAALVGVAGDDGPADAMFDVEEIMALVELLGREDVDVLGKVVTEVTIEEATCWLTSFAVRYKYSLLSSAGPALPSWKILR
jgi:hypothetical protein